MVMLFCDLPDSLHFLNMVDYSFEYAAMKQFGVKYVCGIDEAGRGPWAGPVVAAAVILNPNHMPNGLDDSKKLNENQRNRLAIEIKDTALGFSIAFIDAPKIDEINILQATLLAMKNALESLSPEADFALIDGNRMPKLDLPCQTIIKGDGKSASIAAASILAKTARDDFMIECHEKFPHYGFDKHKGYGVPAHIEALEKHGPCPLHRFSYKPISKYR
ncbi:MAG: ribonuclease HII [Pseudomonadota bacterium]